MESLTVRQRKIYKIILAHFATHGTEPTMRTLAAGIGSPNPHAPECHLDALERKGFIKRTESSKRRIVIPAIDGICRQAAVDILKGLDS